MTTSPHSRRKHSGSVVEAYRLDRYDNMQEFYMFVHHIVVEAYRLDRYDNTQDNAPWA